MDKTQPTNTTKPDTIAGNLPNVPMYRAMAIGHRIRKGHELKASLRLVKDDLYEIDRECCQD